MDQVCPTPPRPGCKVAPACQGGPGVGARGAGGALVLPSSVPVQCTASSPRCPTRTGKVAASIAPPPPWVGFPQTAPAAIIIPANKMPQWCVRLTQRQLWGEEHVCPMVWTRVSSDLLGHSGTEQSGAWGHPAEMLSPGSGPRTLLPGRGSCHLAQGNPKQTVGRFLWWLGRGPRQGCCGPWCMESLFGAHVGT